MAAAALDYVLLRHTYRLNTLKTQIQSMTYNNKLPYVVPLGGFN
jgi:hypothetical protein